MECWGILTTTKSVEFCFIFPPTLPLDSLPSPAYPSATNTTNGRNATRGMSDNGSDEVTIRRGINHGCSSENSWCHLVDDLPLDSRRSVSREGLPPHCQWPLLCETLGTEGGDGSMTNLTLGNIIPPYHTYNTETQDTKFAQLVRGTQRNDRRKQNSPSGRNVPYDDRSKTQRNG